MGLVLERATVARQAKCAEAGHLPVKPSPEVLRDSVPFWMHCECGAYSWMPVKRSEVQS